ncbi:MAG: hypothetical protein ACI865_000037 [Flavobacteriaceae bacterium]|jgi:hypothetical protein
MKKLLLPLVIVLSACGSAEITPFCKCVAASDALNNAQVELLDNQAELEKADPADLEALRDTKTAACKDFSMISQEEGIELKKACEEN